MAKCGPVSFFNPANELDEMILIVLESSIGFVSAILSVFSRVNSIKS